MTTGQIIKKLRESQDMTQETVAELMGYSHKSSINKIEMGKADLPQSKLLAFAKLFNVSPCYLLGIEDNPATDEDKKLWNEKFNYNDILHDETALWDIIQQAFGKNTTDMLHLFVQLNNQGQKKAISNVSDLTLIDQYNK